MSKKSDQHLNLFALPSQTSIIFYLLVMVLWGAIFTSLFDTQVVPLWPLGLLLLVLPFYGFLLRPEIEKKKYRLVLPDAGEYSHLHNRIEEVAQHIGLRYVPVLWLDKHRSQSIYSFGTFRRWYIIINLLQAQKLEKWLADPEKKQLADVQIVHELYHFGNGDIWKLGLLTELFRYSILVMGWGMLFMLGFGIFLIQARESFLNFSVSDVVAQIPVEFRSQVEPFLLSILPSSQAIIVIQDKARSINLFRTLNFALDVTLPYVVLAVFLWLFYRPLLWRVREYYADAGVFHYQKSGIPFLRFTLENKKVFLASHEININTLPKALHRLKAGFERILKFIHGNFWPEFGARWQAYQSPETIFYTWKQIGQILGGLLLALEIFLATPLTLVLYGRNPLLFPTIIGLVGLFFFFLPHIVLGKKILQDALKALLLISFIRAGWMFLTLFFLWAFYIIAPNSLAEFIKSAIASTAHYAGTQIITLDLLDFLLTASTQNLLQIPIVFLLQGMGLSLLIFLLHKILTWYEYLNSARRFKNILLAITISVCAILGILMLIIMSELVGSEYPFHLVIFGLTVALLLWFWFYLLDRRYHARCHVCSHLNVQNMHPIMQRCESCHTLLIPWLTVEQDEN